LAGGLLLQVADQEGWRDHEWVMNHSWLGVAVPAGRRSSTNSRVASTNSTGLMCRVLHAANCNTWLVIMIDVGREFVVTMFDPLQQLVAASFVRQLSFPWGTMKLQLIINRFHSAGFI
jgi:hypothetical protein